MSQVKFLLILSFLAASLASRDIHNIKSNRDRHHEKTINDDNLEVAFMKTKTDLIPSGAHKSEAVVENFVETLIASERYLKMIEGVERKVNHLDATFHEKTNTILKYVSEMLRMLKVGPSSSVDSALRVIKMDIDKLKMSLSERLDRPIMRADSTDFHADSSLDTRLTIMDSQIKNIMSGVESIVSIISEVKSRQFAKTYQRGGADSVIPPDSISLINEFRRTLHDQKRKCDCKTGRVDRSERFPTDCHEIQMQGFNVSGIYKVKPDDLDPFYVLCDLTTAGGGWTVLQNRFDGSQDFYKGWNDYKNGFGNLAGEFWLGLEKVNFLTNQKLYELRIEIETHHGLEAYAVYSVFTIGPEYEGYRISTLGTYYGTAGDSLSYHAGQKFSTMDTDNDEWKDGMCAVEHGGAWWYKECDKSNLNGKYSTTADENRGQSIYWISFKGPNVPLMKTKMMIRPLPASRPNDLADPSRKILESLKMRAAPDKQSVRAMDRKAPYDVSNAKPPYNRYEHRADAFFPNYK